MSGWRPPSSLGNFACKLRKEDCASLSVFCEESCTTNPLAAPSAAGGMAAVRGRAGAPQRARRPAAQARSARARALRSRCRSSCGGRSGRRGCRRRGSSRRRRRGHADRPAAGVAPVRANGDRANLLRLRSAEPAVLQTRPVPTGAGGAARGAESATGSSCLETSCSFSAVASRSWTALLDCGSPAVAGTILVGVELSAAMTGGGWVELGTPE